MHPYTQTLLIVDRHAELHREAAHRRLATLVRGSSATWPHMPDDVLAAVRRVAARLGQLRRGTGHVTA